MVEVKEGDPDFEKCDEADCPTKATSEEFDACMRSLTCRMDCMFEMGCKPCDGCCQPATCGDDVVNTSINASNVVAQEECDDSKDDTCNNCFRDRRVFVTSKSYCGNMNPRDDKENCIATDDVQKTFGKTLVERGDARCQELAGSANLPNPATMKAWLSVNAMDQPAARFSAATNGFSGRYMMMRKEPVGEILVAEGWEGLVDGLDLPDEVKGLEFDEMGEPRASVTVWTNTNADGSSGPKHCKEWTNIGNESGGFGRTDITDLPNSEWTTALNADVVASATCSTPNRLYCFEDPDPPAP